MEIHSASKEIRIRTEKLLSNTELNNFEIVQNFPVFTSRRNIARFLSHYELFQKQVNLPGVIIDLGIYRGASTFTWAKLCEIFCPTDILKKVYAFDSFEGFPSISEHDGKPDDKNDLKINGFFGGNSIEKDLILAQKAMEPDKHIRDLDRIEFIKGDVIESIPKFVNEKGNGLKISLLNLDLDLYEPTKIALEFFIPKMVKGGIIIIDEYALENFGGETKAIDEYFLENFKILPNVKKFTWHSNPSAYIEF